MPSGENEGAVSTQSTSTQLEEGTYELIRTRLGRASAELRGRLDQLNSARKDVFGSTETELIGTERITTQHNCVPGDIVAIGGTILLGYNVFFGLKSETTLADVFAVYAYRDHGFHAQDQSLLADERLQKDFREIYRYYKNAVFSRFVRHEQSLYAVFQVGNDTNDVKSLKWTIHPGELRYAGNRFDHELRPPPQHEFEWARTTRDQHRFGEHPHISIDDRVFVETVGGDLTIKIENNTASGAGIYAEPVDNPDQTLDDASIHYAIIDNLILLKIQPYQENQYRYFVFNEKNQQATRIDAIADSCIRLPEDHGLIFSHGFYLQSGESQSFDVDTKRLSFERRHVSANGEDTLYTFYSPPARTYVLLQYNVIERKVSAPIVCNGYAILDHGELLCFRAQDTAQKHHALQIWRTPYGDETPAPAKTDSYLQKIGNREIVRVMAECHQVLNLISKDESYSNLYIDLSQKASDIANSYFWIDDPRAFNLKEPLETVKTTATAAIDEYEKLLRTRENTRTKVTGTADHLRDLLRDVKHRSFAAVEDFVDCLHQMRTLRGEIIGLRELRYVDAAEVDGLEARLVEETDRLAHRCVEFLLRPDALDPFQRQIHEYAEQIPQLTKVADAQALDQKIDDTAAGLELLIEIVGNLDISDATQRTQIVDNISEIFSHLNQTRAKLKNSKRDLMSAEGMAEFSAQIKLISQGVTNYLDLCDDPEKCDEYLTKLMVQLEELEAQFAEFDDFVLQLSEKRQEIYNAFEGRKVALIEARNKRAATLMSAAERILKGVQTRSHRLETIDEIHGYFAADLMISKVRDIVEQLQGLDDTVKADDVQSRLKTIREDAIRQLRDRQDLFTSGDNVIRFGDHHFSVNTQSLDLTTVLRDDQLFLHLTGTSFFEAIDDPTLNDSAEFWSQELPSENADVYRAEYLAYVMLSRLVQENGLATFSGPDAEPELRQRVERFMAPRYAEGYVKGVHDHDAAKILHAAVRLARSIGPLRYPAEARALATLYWRQVSDRKERNLLSTKLRGVGNIDAVFPQTPLHETYQQELETRLRDFAGHTGLFEQSLAHRASEYLYEQLASGQDFFFSRRAVDLAADFRAEITEQKVATQFDRSCHALRDDPVATFQLIRYWIDAFLIRHPSSHGTTDRDEITLILMQDEIPTRQIIDVAEALTCTELLGSHPRIGEGKYDLHYGNFVVRLDRFHSQTKPRYEQYLTRKSELIQEQRDALKLEEFQPKILSSFVRNRLIDSVYLPLIGDNLAKQIGAAGSQKRTDRMGLLLLISPPGYGKTTLMEYVANRLGIIFMKINGPAIGHGVTSLDPDDAPNATARQELQKLGLAFEMGDNVMIYVDDIQHCHPEFLQKFISLCDAQRKIEGVYRGETRTYDFRGRKVAVVMAGNPYTESGERFQIPDMLANRADVYNLGEIIGDQAEAFEMSYLENSLTSNPTLSILSSRSRHDVHTIIRIAQFGQQEGDELEANYSTDELADIIETMKKMIRVRDVVLTVNREYIRSAAQADEYRTEPPFRLQGSYRNMNRIAEKIFPLMNNQELETVIFSSYENEAQTLTSGTEANLLKFRELLGQLTPEEGSRWEEIKTTFRRNTELKGLGDDQKVGQLLLQLGALREGLGEIRDSVQSAMTAVAPNEPAAPSATEWKELLFPVETALQRVAATISDGWEQKPAAVAPSPSPAEMPSETTPEQAAVLGSPTHAKEITVINKLPRTILNVIRQQFEVMQGWMAPVLTASQSQQKEFQDLKRQVEQCLLHYQRLLKQLTMADKKTVATQKTTDKKTAKKKTAKRPRPDAPPPPPAAPG